jgi:hypothetical protein
LRAISSLSTHHKKNLLAAFKDLKSDEAKKITREGLDRIHFDKYKALYGGLLQEAVMAGYCDGQ